MNICDSLADKIITGDEFNAYVDSTLMAMSKNDLICIIRALERNLRNVEKVCDRQHELLTKAMENSCGAASSCAMVCEVEE